MCVLMTHAVARAVHTDQLGDTLGLESSLDTHRYIEWREKNERGEPKEHRRRQERKPSTKQSPGIGNIEYNGRINTHTRSF